MLELWLATDVWKEQVEAAEFILECPVAILGLPVIELSYECNGLGAGGPFSIPDAWLPLMLPSVDAIVPIGSSELVHATFSFIDMSPNVLVDTPAVLQQTSHFRLTLGRKRMGAERNVLLAHMGVQRLGTH
jgi:hypothetical protein